MTGAKGYFALNLGRDAAVLPLFPADHWPPTFAIDTSRAAGFPTTMQVTFREQTSSQENMAVPQEVLTGGSTNLGTILVISGDGGGSGRGDDGGEPASSSSADLAI